METKRKEEKEGGETPLSKALKECDSDIIRLCAPLLGGEGLPTYGLFGLGAGETIQACTALMNNCAGITICAPEIVVAKVQLVHVTHSSLRLKECIVRGRLNRISTKEDDAQLFIVEQGSLEHLLPYLALANTFVVQLK